MARKKRRNGAAPSTTPQKIKETQLATSTTDVELGASKDSSLPPTSIPESRHPDDGVFSKILCFVKRNGPVLTTIGMILQTIAIVVQVVIAGVMVYSLKLSHDNLKLSERQFHAAVDPDLRLFPKNTYFAKEMNESRQPGVFDFVLKNSGVDDLEEIDVAEDFFAVFRSPTNGVQLQLVLGGMIFKRGPTFAHLPHGCETNYPVDMSKILSQFKDVGNNPMSRGESRSNPNRLPPCERRPSILHDKNIFD